MNFSPRGGGGGGRGDVDIMFCVHILSPAQTTDYQTFYMTLCDTVYSGDAIGSFVSLYICFNVASLRLVLVIWLHF